LLDDIFNVSVGGKKAIKIVSSTKQELGEISCFSIDTSFDLFENTINQLQKIDFSDKKEYILPV
jgi:hypothetical protein